MNKLFRETILATVFFAVFAYIMRIGMAPGDGWGVVAVNAAVFGVFYFIIGLVIRYFRERGK